MKTRQLTDNLWQLTRLRFVNAYLVREQDGFTLVDTTLGGAADDLIAAAAAAGGEITRVLLTHGHGDHIGSLDGLRARLASSIEVAIGELDGRILAGEKVVEGKLPGSWPKVSTKPDQLLAGGERIGSLEVVRAPGHTPGHVAFLDVRDRSLIAGDVFTAIGGLAVSSHFHLRFPLAQGATWDKAEDLDSARRLAELDPSLLVVGHGGALRAPRAAIDAAVAAAEAAARG